MSKKFGFFNNCAKIGNFFKTKNDFDFGNDEQICFDKYVELIRVIAVCNNFYKQPFVCF